MNRMKLAFWPIALALSMLAECAIPAPLAAQETASAPTAEEHFKWYCVQCHGPLGNGKGVNNSRATRLPVSPRNLTDGKDISQFSDEDITRTITHGGGVNDLSPIMPPWGDVFTPEEIRALVAHVRKICRCQFDPKAKERAMREAGKIPPQPESRTRPEESSR